MKNTLKGRLGFTLIELLVVVLIIGILAAIALPQYQKAVLKSQYAKMLPVIRTVANAQKAFYLANGRYATSFDELDVTLTPSSIPSGQACPGWGSTQTVYSNGVCLAFTESGINAIRTTVTYKGTYNMTKAKTAGRNGYYYLFEPKYFASKTGLYCTQSTGEKDGHCGELTKTFGNDWGDWYYMGTD